MPVLKHCVTKTLLKKEYEMSNIYNKQFKVISFVVAVCIACVVIAMIRDIDSKGAVVANGPVVEQLVVADKLVPEETLAEVTIWMMNTPKCSGSKSNGLSEVKKTMLARQIDRILTTVGGDRRTQEAFIFLMCQESQYRTNLTSSAGAKGIAQMMPATAQAEADNLKMGKLTPDDLFDAEINILLGYTHFKGLAANYNGNLAKASAGYNGGAGSSSLKAMKSGGPGAHETDAYVRDLYNMSEERRIAKIERAKGEPQAKAEPLITTEN